MTLSETLISIAAGSALTLLAGYVLHRLQASKADADASREFQRALHNDLIDLIADARRLFVELAMVVDAGRFWSKDVATLVDTMWFGGLDVNRRLDRMRTGHPDPIVRQALHEVDSALSTLMKATLYTKEYLLQFPDRVADDRLSQAERDSFLRLSQAAFLELDKCVHGQDVEVIDLTPPRAKVYFDET